MKVIKSARRMLQFSLALSLLTSAQHCIVFLLSLPGADPGGGLQLGG